MNVANIFTRIAMLKEFSVLSHLGLLSNKRVGKEKRDLM
jgi:hypothetical protein